MASDAQIRANRDNSKKSTGPRTPAGKDISRFNATRHNITGAISLRTGPEKEAFDAFYERLIPDFDTDTDLESELAARAIDVLFRLARISAVEGNILTVAAADASAATPPHDAPAAPPLDPAIDRAVAEARAFMRESRTLSNLSLYEQRLSRTLHSDLDTLRQLRGPKGLKTAPPREINVRWVSSKPEPSQPAAGPTPVPDPRIGFVISPTHPHPAPPGIAA